MPTAFCSVRLTYQYALYAMLYTHTYRVNSSYDFFAGETAAQQAALSRTSSKGSNALNESSHSQRDPTVATAL
jgi:hypothetical protein